MAIRLPNGSIQMADGRVIFANSVIVAADLLEILPLVTPPPAWPFVSGGGGGGSGSGTPGARGADGAAGPQGPQGTNPGAQGPQGLQGFQGPGLTTDIFAADRVVDPAGAGTDLTLASALAGLPATGGKIYIKAGAYVIPTLALPDKSVEIVGGGVGSTVITGPSGAAFFTSAFDHNRIFRDITFLGDGSAGQIFLNQTVALSGANKIDIQNIVIPSGSGIEKIFVFAASARLEILDCSIFATASAASRFVDGPVGAVIVAVYGTLMGGGGGISGSLVQISAVNSTFTLLNGFVIDSDSTFVACTLNSGLLTLGSDCGVTDCLFINGANISIAGSRVTITGSDFIGGPPTRWIDIVASGSVPLAGSITGCLFGAVTSEAVRIAQTGWTVSQNALCKVTETGAANFNRYDNNTGFGGSTIIGQGSLVENENFRNVRTWGAVGDGVTDDTAAIQAAIAALPTAGGVLYFPQGTYLVSTTLTMPDKPVVVRGAGDGTIISLGANAIAAFTIPTGLTVERVYTFEDFEILGTAVANQRGWSVQDTNSRGVVNINRVDTNEIQFPIQVTAGSGSSPVLVNVSDCYFQQLADNSSILIVNSPAFPVVNLAMLRVRFYRAFEDAVVGALAQGGYFVNFTNVNIIGKDSYFSNGSVDCTIGALNLENCSVLNYAPSANTRVAIADDNFSAVESAVVGCQITFVDFEMAGNGTKFVGCTMDSSSFKDGAISFFGDCYFIGGPGATPATAVITGVNDTVIDGCFFDDIGGGSFSVVSPRIVSGCAFRTSAPPTASIDLPSGNAVITGNYFEAGVPIRETTTANNIISGNKFAGSAPTLLAAGNTILDNEHTRTVTGTPVTVGIADRTILVDATAAPAIVNLPTAASAVFRKITIKKVDATANTVTVTPAGAEVIDGVTPVVLTVQWERLTIQSDGTAWFRVD